MSTPAVIPLDEHRRQSRRFRRALAARAILRAAVEDSAGEAERPTGRAWINGREVGGTMPRHAHLTVSYD
jgi:hypothetical protein